MKSPMKQEEKTMTKDVAMSSESLNVERFRRDNSHGNKEFVVGKYTICLKGEERQPALVYSRVMGYFRPVQSWNTGKKQEYADRKVFIEPKEE